MQLNAKLKREMNKRNYTHFDLTIIKNKEMISTDVNGKLIQINPKNPDNLPEFFPVKNNLLIDVQDDKDML